MLKTIPAALTAVAIGATSLFGFAAAGPATAGPHQEGLVNVAITDVTIQVPIGVAANICDVNVNVLAAQLDDGAPCNADADPDADAVVTQGSGPGGTQKGLVNIYAANLIVQLPIGIAANVCDVNANVLARQLDTAAPCDAVADPDATIS